MLETFSAADAAITAETFLETFQSSGCYLIDLCPEPVDHLDASERRAVCRASEKPLSRTIARLQPPAIATVVRSIEGNVARAAALAEWQCPVTHLPYPGRWSRHRLVFVDTLLPAIIRLLQQ